MYDGLFVVYARTRDAAERVVSDHMGSSFNRVLVIPLSISDPDDGTVELEFWYDQPAKVRGRARA